MELDPYHLKLTAKPMRFTMLKGIPGVLRDASPDAWGRRVIQARLEKKESEIAEMEYLLNGPDDGAGNLRFGLSVQSPGQQSPSTVPISSRRWSRRLSSLRRRTSYLMRCWSSWSPERAWVARGQR